MHFKHTKPFWFCRFLVRCVTPRYRTVRIKEADSPAVYVVRHQNLRGPFVVLSWFDKPLRTWVLDVFFDNKSCFRQYYNYTFTKRFGIPRPIAAIIAFPVSFFISWLMRIISAIPVFRGSRNIIETFRQSIDALLKGHDLLICPDIDYKDSSSDIGEMYNGFLNLEKYYLKHSGKHLAFIPLYINNTTRTIYQGEAVYFDDGTDFKRERAKVYNRLKEEYIRLKKQAEDAA